MRYHKAGNTLAMLMDEAIPRRTDGALDLCHECQRWMWFRGGYISLLTRHLEALASRRKLTDGIPKWAAKMTPGEKREWWVSNPEWREATRERVKALADKLGRSYRVRTWTHGLVEVWRLA